MCIKKNCDDKTSLEIWEVSIIRKFNNFLNTLFAMANDQMKWVMPVQVSPRRRQLQKQSQWLFMSKISCLSERICSFTTSKSKLAVTRHHLETRSRSNFKFSFEISIYLYCCFVLMTMTGDVGRGGSVRFDYSYKSDYEIEFLLVFSPINPYLSAV